ncbi:hypothetical protein GCM10010515_58020 [Streptomyces fructofermentans]|uniref:peptide-methionine (R)-S-oxide reductase n=1 Tax=Streptomyces fructofermentans TaxID=152141 RepID=A0A918NNL5_9ACTN|nr:hypothetical protein GCM10010515_58020 [Streptomyces fructofermentans]
MSYQVEKSDEEWRAELSPVEYRVLRKAATEPAFTGEYTDTKTKGVYSCRACGAELFTSEEKFDSRSGWPSFYDPKDSDAVELVEDRSLGTVQTEVRAPGAVRTSAMCSPARGFRPLRTSGIASTAFPCG